MSLRKYHSKISSLSLLSEYLSNHHQGEGFLKGGILLISPTKGVTYSHNEMTGFELPYEDITKALKELEK
jgi:hypothetical protein